MERISTHTQLKVCSRVETIHQNNHGNVCVLDHVSAGTLLGNAGLYIYLSVEPFHVDLMQLAFSSLLSTSRQALMQPCADHFTIFPLLPQLRERNMETIQWVQCVWAGCRSPVNPLQSNPSPEPWEKLTVKLLEGKRSASSLHVTSQETWNRHFQQSSLPPSLPQSLPAPTFAPLSPTSPWDALCFSAGLQNQASVTILRPKLHLWAQDFTTQGPPLLQGLSWACFWR